MTITGFCGQLKTATPIPPLYTGFPIGNTQVMLTNRRNLLLFPTHLRDIFDRIVGKTSKDGDQNSNGVREALQIGLTNAVNIASRPDGFFANALIKILLPDKLKPVEKGLRLVGAGKFVDNFVLGMNRAAEKAAPLARDIFVGALKKMTITDALQLLRGGDTAATDYFRKTTSEPLTIAFRTPIAESMQSVGAIDSYKQMVARFQKIPFMKADSFDVETYVTTKAVAGLFFLVGEEEKKIRRNPAARVTPLLREVFGKL